MLNTLNKISEYYDKYVGYQRKQAFNERHLALYSEMKKLGLNQKSNVLEIGCGIGAISFLMAQTVTKGKIISLDISPKSIEAAKEMNRKHTQIEFITSDIVDFCFNGEIKFDFITLFDVLEHIPIESHEKSFGMLSNLMSEKTFLLINIPNPAFLKHIAENFPERLQIIDQPLDANLIMNHAYSNNLNLIFFKTFSIWVKDESQIMLFMKNKPFKEIQVSKPSAIARIKNWFK